MVHNLPAKKKLKYSKKHQSFKDEYQDPAYNILDSIKEEEIKVSRY